MKKFIEVYDEAEFIRKPKYDLILSQVSGKYIWIGPLSLHKKHSKETNIYLKNHIEHFFDSYALDIPRIDGIHPTYNGYAKWVSKFPLTN